MKNYEHISQMENILTQQIQQLNALNHLLDTIDAHKDAYDTLMQYYYSHQRTQDLEDDENHLIPEDLQRGVLSEDGIDDFLFERRNTIMRMLEIAVAMMKQ